MALHISISDDKFPAGGKTYIENYPAIDEVRSGNRISCKIGGHYRATLKTLLSFSLNAAISCPILSLVILA